MNNADFNQQLLGYLQRSTTPYHAVANIEGELESHGFRQLHEGDAWSLQPGCKYYVSRNQGSLIAFHYGTEELQSNGIRMLGAHTDSPCLKVKPNPEIIQHGYYQLGVEVYGGVLLNPWFDRDLSLAGRVSYRSRNAQVKTGLIDFERPLATIPSLAIHLDREANQSRSINAQTDIPPVLMRCDNASEISFHELLGSQLAAQGVDDVDLVLDYELFFYDTQAPAVVGFNHEFIAGARLDNLLSCYTGIQSLLNAGAHSALLICNDHEEVGSRSASGAQGTMLQDFLQRLMPEPEVRSRCLNRSILISTDNAHGIHPNYAAKHDSKHGPLLNGGPVIKVNANQSYATNSETAAYFRHWSAAVDVPVQSFVVRTDMGCGSTIGPLTAAETGVRTLDVGVPTFAMHSIRELAGSGDAYYLYRVLSHFLCADFAW